MLGIVLRYYDIRKIEVTKRKIKMQMQITY